MVLNILWWITVFHNYGKIKNINNLLHCISISLHYCLLQELYSSIIWIQHLQTIKPKKNKIKKNEKKYIKLWK